MFKRDDNNDNPPPVLTGADQTAERPVLPPCRTWRVQRWTPADTSTLETVYVSAHGITHADPNGDIIFSRLVYVMSPQGPAISQIPVRAFSGYYDYELIEEGEQSSIIQ